MSKTITTKYPQVSVRLTGQDGNAFAVLAAVTRALRKAKVSSEEQAKFRDEATSGNYSHLLQTCMKWVDIS